MVVDDANKIIIKSQFEFLYTDPHFFKTIVCARGGGKTYASLDWMMYYLLNSPDAEIKALVFSQTYRQCVGVVAPILQRYIDILGKDSMSFNKQLLTYTIKIGNKYRYVSLVSYENPEAKRGLHPDVIILDEISECKSSVFETVILPMLGNAIERETCRLIAFGTPKGKNQLHRLMQFGFDPEKKNWSSYILKASESKLFSEETLSEIKSVMTDQAYRQEYECDFDACVTDGSIYGDYIRLFEKNNIGDFPYNPKYPVYTGWDLGFSDYCSIWFFQVINGVCTFIDYFEDRGYDTTYYCGVLSRKPYVYATNILPWDGAIGNIRSEHTISEMIENFGFRVECLKKSSVASGIDKSRLLLKTCKFNASTCAIGLEHLKLYKFKEGVGGGKPLHDLHSNCADAFRYVAMSENIWNKAIKNDMMSFNYDYNIF